MRIAAFLILLFVASSIAQKRKPGWFVGGGIDFRAESIDIEDKPRGPSLPDNGPPGETNFWKTLSIHGRFGYSPGKNWFFSTSFYTRYNAFHRVEGINIDANPPKEPRKKKNFKYDVFLDVEKKFRIKKNRERYLFVQGGVGFVNINTRFDITLTDTTSFGTYTKHYKGTMQHLGPRMSVGYQNGPVKFSVDGYITEDANLSTLTAVWIGATLSYEIPTKKGAMIKGPYKKPDAAVYRKQSITRKKIGLYSLVPAAALFLFGRDNLNRNSPNYGSDRSGFTWAGIITSGTSFYCLLSSRHQLKKSKRLVNSTGY